MSSQKGFNNPTVENDVEELFSPRADKREDNKKLVDATNSDMIPILHEEPSHSQMTETSTIQQSQEIFEPCTFFFYGTLMDPEVIRAVALLDELPALQDAWVEGFELKMWHQRYPTLLPREGSSARIKGKIWGASSMAQCVNLQLYETWAYACSDCIVQTEDGHTIKALTFTWAKDPNSEELSEGEFDLEYWQKNHKT